MKTFLEWIKLYEVQVSPHMPHIFVRDSLNDIAEIERKLRSIESVIKLAIKIEDIYGNNKKLKDFWYDAQYTLPLYLKGSRHENYSKSIRDVLKIKGIDIFQQHKYLQPYMLSGKIDRVSNAIVDLTKKNEYGDISDINYLIKSVKEDWDESINDNLNLSKEQSLEILNKTKEIINLVWQYTTLIKKFEKGLNNYFDSEKRRYNRYNDSEKLKSRGLEYGDIPPEYKNTENLFHATPFIKEIQQSGLKVGEQKALGGEVSNSISFTADIKVAREIVKCLREAIAIANGYIKPEDVLQMAKLEGLSNIKDSSAFQNYKIDQELISKRLSPKQDEKHHAFELYRTFMSFSNERYDPVFFGVSVENFQGMDPRNVGIVVAKVDMSKVKIYFNSMEEYRVPPEGVLGFKIIS